MKRVVLMLLMGLSAVSSAITGATTASFTSAVQSTGNTFTAGTMVISSTPTSAVVTLSNMIPGGSIKGDLTVSNAADSVAFTYAMSVDATNADLKSLRTALQFKVESGTCVAPTGTIYDGVLYDPVPGAVVFGDPNLAPRNKRFLASTTSEQLCLTISLPGSAGNPLQTAATTATITLSAIQA